MSTAELAVLELGHRAALYQSIEAVHKCDCHAWWGSALIRYSRNYAYMAGKINATLAIGYHSQLH